MKKLILLLVAVLVLGGAGVGGWYVLLGPGHASGEAGSAPAAPADPFYVEFNPLTLPVVGRQRIEQLITLKLTLEVADKTTADRVIAWAPRLNDAFMTALYGRLETVAMLPNGTIDVEVIKQRVLAASAALMGEGVVRDCLVQSVSQRNLA